MNNIRRSGFSLCRARHLHLRCWLAVWALCFVTPVFSAPSVVDDTGATVRLPKPALRIVSLAPHLTEMLFAIGVGDRIVGAVEYSDYPPEAKKIPRVGGAHAAQSLDLERILALRPDLVVTWGSGNSDQATERLRRLGLAVYTSEPRRLERVASNMARLAVLTDAGEQGEAAVRAFREAVAALRQRYAGQPPLTVFFQFWPQPLMTLSGDHLVSEIMTLCGGINIFAELSVLAPQVDVEAVIVANPQVIIASGEVAGREHVLAQWHAWPQVDAVRDQHLYTVHADLILRQGPRVVLGAEQMCQRLARARGAP